VKGGHGSASDAGSDVMIDAVKRLVFIYGSRSFYMSGMLLEDINNFFFLGRTFLLRMTTPRSHISRR
jgi:hypothetical protein